MKTISFATTNQEKVQIAQTICEQSNSGITVQPIVLEIDEIQGEDPEAIVRDKAKRAFEQYGKPIIVSDDSWDIRALNGFPGAYMKSINHWFTPHDFIRLMHGVDDRRITLHQYLAYTDGKITKVFNNDLTGQIINEIRGRSEKSPNGTVTVLDCDNGKTIAEIFEKSSQAGLMARYSNRQDVWHKFVEWYSKLS